MEIIAYITIPLVLIIIFLVVKLILEKKSRKDIESQLLQVMFNHDKVHLHDELLTPNELRFYHDLQKKFGEKYQVLPLVSLSALFDIKEDQKDLYDQHVNIRKFYFDFVLSTKREFKPFMVIELNDNTKRFSKRRERDAYFSTIFKSGNIKFFSCDSNYITYDHYMDEIEKILNIPSSISDKT